MVDIHAAVEMILLGRQRIAAHENMLVAVSGIDGSGKGYMTERLVACLQQRPPPSPRAMAEVVRSSRRLRYT